MRTFAVALALIGSPFAQALVEHGLRYPPTPLTQPFLRLLGLS